MSGTSRNFAETRKVPGEATAPKRIQLSRKKGYRKPSDTVVVSRPTRWGNPWSMKQGYTRQECVARFETYLIVRRNPHPGWKDFASYPSDEEIRRELAGKDLACWCPTPRPGAPDHCHAAVLLVWANEGVGSDA